MTLFPGEGRISAEGLTSLGRGLMARPGDATRIIKEPSTATIRQSLTTSVRASTTAFRINMPLPAQLEVWFSKELGKWMLWLEGGIMDAVWFERLHIFLDDGLGF